MEFGKDLDCLSTEEIKHLIGKARADARKPTLDNTVAKLAILNGAFQHLLSLLGPKYDSLRTSYTDALKSHGLDL